MIFIATAVNDQDDDSKSLSAITFSDWINIIYVLDI